MKTRKAIFALIVILIIFSLGYFYFRSHQESYIKLFRLTKLVASHNAQGELNGESVYYLNGQVKIRGLFLNGKKDGLEERYFDDGKIKNKKNFKLGLANGNEMEFYPNGKIRYSGNWVNNRKYGDLFYYYQNGALELYHCYDVLEQKFFIIRKDSLGMLLKQDGTPFSSNIYYRTSSDSITVLKENAHYHNLKDLLITVATPPKLNIEFFVKVNDKPIKDLTIKDNTLTIHDSVLLKGINHLSIGGRLLDNNRNVVSTRLFDTSIFID